MDIQNTTNHKGWITRSLVVNRISLAAYSQKWEVSQPFPTPNEHVDNFKHKYKQIKRLYVHITFKNSSNLNLTSCKINYFMTSL